MPKSNHYPTDPRFPAFRAQVEADYGSALPDDAFYAGEEMPHEPYHHETALAFRMFAAGWKAALQQAAEPVAWAMLQRDGSVLSVQAKPYHEGFAQMMATDCGCTVQALGPLSPLPQQTALVEGQSPELDEINGRLA